jgi:amino acid transporter
VPWIASVRPPLSPLQSATCPAPLPEEFGPHELVVDARKSSAKPPLEQAPSVIAPLLEDVAAYALGIICCIVGGPNVAAVATANAATTIIVPVKIVFVFILCILFIVMIGQEIARYAF